MVYRKSGREPFSGCSELATVTIPAGVERIEKLTFKGCSSLSNVIIPDSVTYLGESTFEVASIYHLSHFLAV